MTMPMMVVCVARSERLISRTGFAPTTTTTTTTFDIAWRSFFFRLGHCVEVATKSPHTHTHAPIGHVHCAYRLSSANHRSARRFHVVVSVRCTAPCNCVDAFPPRRRRPAIAHARARAKHAFMCNNIYARERPNNVNELG